MCTGKQWSVMVDTTKTTTYLINYFKSPDTFRGSSSVLEKHFPLISPHLAEIIRCYQVPSEAGRVLCVTHM